MRYFDKPFLMPQNVIWPIVFLQSCKTWLTLTGEPNAFGPFGWVCTHPLGCRAKVFLAQYAYRSWATSFVGAIERWLTLYTTSRQPAPPLTVTNKRNRKIEIKRSGRDSPLGSPFALCLLVVAVNTGRRWPVFVPYWINAFDSSYAMHSYHYPHIFPDEEWSQAEDKHQ